MMVEIRIRRAIALLPSNSDLDKKVAPLYIYSRGVSFLSVCVRSSLRSLRLLAALASLLRRALLRNVQEQQNNRYAAIGSLLRFQFSYSGKTKNYRLNNGDTSDRKLTPWVSYLVRQKQAPCGWYPLAAYLVYLPKTIAFG